jgi:hypothetical protein
LIGKITCLHLPKKKKKKSETFQTNEKIEATARVTFTLCVSNLVSDAKEKKEWAIHVSFALGPIISL